MRRINFPLLIGSIIVLFLLLVALYPGLFTSKDPLFEETPKYIEYKENGVIKEKFAHRPIPPNKDNIFGTDDAGRDMYSRIIYGTRNTMKIALFVALLRMLIALPLGLAAGMGKKFISGIIKIFNTYFTAIPMLIFSFIVLNIGYFRMLQMDKAIIAFSIVLSIVGWAKLASMIEDTTKIIMEEDFIEGEVAIGKTKLQIAYQNVLPHIIPTGISLFFKEMGMALFLVAQLAVLYIFVGVRRFPKSLGFKANFIMGLEPEWGGMLSRIAEDVRRYSSVYWMTLYPILTFAIAIIGINLTGEGLRIEFQKRNSRVISNIRKAYYLISPKAFISQIMDFKKYYKPVIIKTLVIIGIIGYFLIPWNPSLYEFDIDETMLHLEELISDKYEGRATGTKGGYLAGEYIIDALNNYGYEVEIMEIPLTDTIIDHETNNEIIMPKPISPLTIESGWIKLKDNMGEEKTYYLHKDFTIASVNKNIFRDMSKKELNYKGIAADAENGISVPEGRDFFGINYGFDFSPVFGASYINLFSEYEYNNQSWMTIGKNKRLKYDIDFRILDEVHERVTNAYLYRATTIIPFGDFKKELENGYKEVEINFDYPKVAEYPGRNIMAFLPGKGKTKHDPGEVIVIGASYDGTYNNGENPFVMSGAPSAIALEIAREISLMGETLDKSIEFVFWDNEFEPFKFSPRDGSAYYNLTEMRAIDMSLSHGYYYIDINYPGYKFDKNLYLTTLPAQRKDGNNYLVGLEIEKRLKRNDVDYLRFHHYGMNLGGALYQLNLNALTSIGIGNPSTEGLNGIKDNLENLNYKRMEDIGQSLLDTLTMNPHLMDKK